jgi:anti-sigma factor RsiW
VTCREFADFMMEYLSDELSAGSRDLFEKHLRICVNCQNYLRSYEESMTLGKRAFEDPAAPLSREVPEELVKAILAARRKA